MKKIFFIAIALMFFGAANAQNIRYQGEVSIGYGVGVGTFGMDRVPIHTVHGVRISENFFVGAGIGVDMFTQGDESATVIPIFANAKGYLPLSKHFALLAALDFGYGVESSDGGNIGGLYIYPQVGCSAKVTHRNAIDFTVGYNNQSFSQNGAGINMGAIGFKVAFSW